jgi:uracil phosphoribosyltransferase
VATIVSGSNTTVTEGSEVDAAGAVVLTGVSVLRSGCSPAQTLAATIRRAARSPLIVIARIDRIGVIPRLSAAS